MQYLKLLFNFIKYLVIKNPIKILLTVVAFVTFHFAETLPGEWEYVDLVSQAKHKNTYVYVIGDEKNTSGYQVLTSDKQETIKDGQLAVWDYHDGNVVLWIFFGISTLIVVIATFVPEDDVNWDFEYVYQRAITTLIYCELEEDTYYYMVMGRLIEKRKDQIRYTSNIANELRLTNLSDIYRLPKFSTKNQKRNNLLNSLGI